MTSSDWNQDSQLAQNQRQWQVRYLTKKPALICTQSIAPLPLPPRGPPLHQSAQMPLQGTHMGLHH